MSISIILKKILLPVIFNIFVFVYYLRTLQASKITHLPGFNGSLPFYLETGYVAVNEESGAELFYYFVESERNPSEDPLLIWLIGGPYCSGFTGLAIDIGPLSFKIKAYDGTLPTLIYNPYSWTKISSIIFLDWPVGTGFSFSRSMSDYVADDILCAKQIYKFLIKWLLSHPSFQSNQFYVGGDSYGGTITPLVAQEIVEGNEDRQQLFINLKGYLVGNPPTSERPYTKSQVYHAHGLGIISDELLKLILINCMGEDYKNPESALCGANLNTFNGFLSEIQIKSILEPLCAEEPTPKKLYEASKSFKGKSLEFHCSSSQPYSDCTTAVLLSYYWSNDNSTKEALRIKEMASGDEHPSRRGLGDTFRRIKKLASKRRPSQSRVPHSPPQDDPVSPPTATQVPSTFPQPARHSYAGTSSSVPPPSSPGLSTTDGRQLIEPDGDSFYPSQQTTHAIRDIIRTKFDAPYTNWKKIPLPVRDMWFREFEKLFRWAPHHKMTIRQNFERRGATRLRDMFSDIRKRGERPSWMGEGVWAELSSAWVSPEYEKKRAQNKMNRASDVGGLGSALHTGGSVPHTEHRRRLKQMLGREPTPLELHERTHQRQHNKEWVDAKSKKAYEDYMSLPDEMPASTPPSQADLYARWNKAVGGKQHGRTYGLGSQATAYDTASAPPSEDFQQYIGAHVAAMTAEIKAHMEALVETRVQAELRQIREEYEARERAMGRAKGREEEEEEEEEESDETNSD